MFWFNTANMQQKHWVFIPKGERDVVIHLKYQSFQKIVLKTGE